MRVLWTTDDGPDPALLAVFPADRPDTVAPTVVDGRPVFVTTSHFEEFCNCSAHGEERCAEPGVRVWDRATGERLHMIPDVDGFHLATLEIGGRPYAVVWRFDGPRRTPRNFGRTVDEHVLPYEIGALTWTGANVLPAACRRDLHLLGIGE